MHYFLIAGYVFDISDSVKLKPAGMLKVVRDHQFNWMYQPMCTSTKKLHSELPIDSMLPLVPLQASPFLTEPLLALPTTIRPQPFKSLVQGHTR